MEEEVRQEQILVRITGQDRPGLTASIMGILAKLGWLGKKLYQFDLETF